MPEALTKADFEPYVGAEMPLRIGAADTRATLMEVRVLKSPSPRAGEPFALLFHVPNDMAPLQGTHRLDHPTLGCLEIFLVPMGPIGPVMRYEAIFN